MFCFLAASFCSSITNFKYAGSREFLDIAYYSIDMLAYGSVIITYSTNSIALVLTAVKSWLLISRLVIGLKLLKDI